MKYFLTALFLIFASSTIVSKPTPEIIQSEPIIFSKKEIVIRESSKQFLITKNPDNARVWVFFTDKGILDQSSYKEAISKVVISAKRKLRKLKAGIDKITFAELPVPDEYINQIKSLGAVHRTTSKWLTAASFDIPFDLLDEISLLSFVSEIKPVATYKRDASPFPESKIDPQRKSQSVDGGIDYGIATGQLFQINVQEAHDKGFDGTGVTLAIFDTGFRKSHEAFAQHFLDNRVLDEYDFVFDDGNTSNEPEDFSSQWNHGTYIWSVSGGGKFGQMVGPAYKANFLLAKTEDVGSETIVEEDNWMNAVEWADSLGADVITSSLGYSNWYSYADYDGETAITTIAANLAVSFGIVVCNSMGNSGPEAGTLTAPADAFEILAVGAVNSAGTLASFSSRGPTFDGRMKPEVCARGVSTAAASASSDNSYANVSGTSLSTPLVAGAAVLLVQARPTLPPQIIREALMNTADNADLPDNNYGHGVINLGKALDYGSGFTADVNIGVFPLTVQFQHDSTLNTSSWEWDFGDGNFAFEQNPQHIFTEAGIYDISLTVTTPYGDLTSTKSSLIIVAADTLTFESDSAASGYPVELSVNLTNSIELNSIIIPFVFEDTFDMTFDSANFGLRTNYFEKFTELTKSPTTRTYTIKITANNGGGSPLLAVGSGEILKLFFTISEYADGGLISIIDSSTNSTFTLKLESGLASYEPKFVPGSIKSIYIERGDVDFSREINIADLTYFVKYFFKNGAEPITIFSSDLDGNLDVNIVDLTYFVNYLFKGGPPPPP